MWLQHRDLLFLRTYIVSLRIPANVWCLLSQLLEMLENVEHTIRGNEISRDVRGSSLATQSLLMTRSAAPRILPVMQ